MQKKDIIDPYIPFTLLALTFPTLSMLWTPSPNYYLGGLTLAALFIGLYGMHAWDLMKGAYQDVPAKTKQLFGGLMLLIAISIGVYISIQVSYWLLIIVALEAVIGVAYNIELLDGLLHDDKGGVITFGITWTFLPCIFMSALMGDLTLSAIVFAASWAIFVMPILLLYEAAKPTIHEMMSLIDYPGEGPDAHDTKMVIIIAVFTWIASFWVLVVSFILRFTMR